MTHNIEKNGERKNTRKFYFLKNKKAKFNQSTSIILFQNILAQNIYIQSANMKNTEKNGLSKIFNFMVKFRQLSRFVLVNSSNNVQT